MRRATRAAPTSAAAPAVVPEPAPTESKGLDEDSLDVSRRVLGLATGTVQIELYHDEHRATAAVYLYIAATRS